jgi:hypothetical protein
MGRNEGQEFAMSDDKRNRGSLDRKRINIHESFELRGWSKKLGVSEEALKAAVAAAGTCASGSERHNPRQSRRITDVNNILRQWNELHESFVPERFEGQTLTYVSSCQAVSKVLSL